MSVVKEVIYEIDFWSPPGLKKHRYSMDSVAKKIRRPSNSATGILMQEISRRDRVARDSGTLEETPASNIQSDVILDPKDMPQAYVPTEDNVQVTPEKKQKPAKQFRVLKRIGNVLYDDTLLQMGQLEDEAYEELNADGYYDEPLPLDSDEYYDDYDDHSQAKKVVIVLGFIAVLVVVLIGYVKYLM